MSPRAPRTGPALPVYLLPVRIQQGWGDLAELAHAAWALHRAGVPLVDLPIPATGNAGRRDPRCLPVDPRASGPVRFPPVRRLDRPLRVGRAVVLTSWWGVSARRRDAEGGPLPGPLEPVVGPIQQAHGAGNVLVVSLEEFASDQTSTEAMDEALRQAGWDGPRRRRSLTSPEGRSQVAAYHRSFVVARGGDREDVLHLTATFAPHPPALEEFPFLLPVGPFGPRRPAPGRRPRPARTPTRPSDRSPRVVVWYAAPPSSLAMAERLVPALDRLSRAVELQLRASPAVADRIGALATGRVVVRLLPELAEAAWEERWRSADVRITSGSQTLVEGVRLRLPMLYFNGLVVEPNGTTRAFRREKLVSLLRAMGPSAGRGRYSEDLERFADGEDLEGILRRAFTDAAWRQRATSALGELPMGFPPPLDSGDAYLVAVLRRFAEHRGPVEELVRQLRREHAAQLLLAR